MSKRDLDEYQPSACVEESRLMDSDFDSLFVPESEFDEFVTDAESDYA